MNKVGPVCRKRLLGDIRILKKDPHKYIDVATDDKDILTWYFLIRGPEFSEYNQGYYIGKIVYPQDYPFKAPDFYMLTESGRFKIGAKICLTNSSYHSDEWSPQWTIHATLSGFLSVMLDDVDDGISHIHKSKSDRKAHAENSIKYNETQHRDILKLFSRFVDEEGKIKKIDF